MSSLLNTVVNIKEKERECVEESENTSIIFFATKNEEYSKTVLQKIQATEEFKDAGWIWAIWDWDLEDLRVMKKILEICGVQVEADKSKAFILKGGGEGKYRWDGDYEGENHLELVEWLKKYKAGELQQSYKCAPRPENDADPEHPGITIVTRDSFKEIVMDKSKDVFVDVFADWCPPCRILGPIISSVGAALKDIPEILICKFDSVTNDKPADIFPENHVPIMKIFPQDKKDEPIPYEGERSVTAFLEFISKHSVHQFDVTDILEREKLVKEVNEKLKQLEELLSEAREGFKDFKFSGEAKHIEERISVYKTALLSPEQLENAANLDEWTEEMEKEKEGMKEYIEKNHKKNVVTIHSTDDWVRHVIQEHRSDDKLVLMDFSASWCPPCHQFSPIYAAFSEKFENVLFLKGDDSDTKDLGSLVGIEAYPTVKFYKNGKQIASVEGLDIQKILLTIMMNGGKIDDDDDEEEEEEIEGEKKEEKET